MDKHIAFGTKIIPVLELDDFEQLNLDHNTQQELSPAEMKAYIKTTEAYQWLMSLWEMWTKFLEVFGREGNA